MKRLIGLILIFISVLSLLNCSKDKITHINCDGLINDPPIPNEKAGVFMPNAFSSNNDGINDFCKPIAWNVASIDFTLYDEKNNIVFATTQIGQGWKPPTLPNRPTKYYYKIQAVTLNNRKIGICGETLSISCLPEGWTTYYFNFEDELDQFGGWSTPSAEPLTYCR